MFCGYFSCFSEDHLKYSKWTSSTYSNYLNYGGVTHTLADFLIQIQDLKQDVRVRLCSAFLQSCLLEVI